MPYTTIKPAGLFWGFVLRKLGFAGIYMPTGIYILPEWINDRCLIAHEQCHAMQRYRDGFFVFWWLIFYYIARYGYWNSPYEIEARAAAGAYTGYVPVRDPGVPHDRCHGIPDATCPRCEVDDGPQRTPPKFNCTGRPRT